MASRGLLAKSFRPQEEAMPPGALMHAPVKVPLNAEPQRPAQHVIRELLNRMRGQPNQVAPAMRYVPQEHRSVLIQE
jgi:hypothetical protein